MRESATCSAWNPMTLSFSDDELESQYRAYTTANWYLPLDVAFVYVSLFVQLTIALASSISGFPYRPESVIVNVASGLCIYWFINNRRHWYLRNRTILTMIYRSFRMCVTLVHFSSVEASLNERQIAARGLILCGTSFFWCLGMQLIFKVHVILHLISMVVAYLYVWPLLCLRSSAWKKMSEFMTFASHGLHREADCRRLVLFVFFTCGYVIPTAMLWTQERDHRMRFMRARGIHLQGNIGRYYMSLLLFVASLCVFMLTVFDAYG